MESLTSSSKILTTLYMQYSKQQLHNCKVTPCMLVLAQPWVSIQLLCQQYTIEHLHTYVQIQTDQSQSSTLPPTTCITNERAGGVLPASPLLHLQYSIGCPSWSSSLHLPRQFKLRLGWCGTYCYLLGLKNCCSSLCLE